MAFTEQEITALKSLKERGMNKEQALDILAKAREKNAASTSGTASRASVAERKSISTQITELRAKGLSEQDINKRISATVGGVNPEPEKKVPIVTPFIEGVKQQTVKAFETGAEARESLESGKTGEAVLKTAEAGLELVKSPIRGVEKVAEPVVGAAVDFGVSQGGKALRGAIALRHGEEKADAIIEGLKSGAAESIQQATEAYDKLPSGVQAAVDLALETAELPLLFGGSKLAKEGGKTTAKVLQEGAEVAGEALEGVAKKTAQAISIKDPVKAAEKMSNLAKILPKEVDEFKRLSGGKSHGDWLVERGLVSDRETLVKDLSKRFKDSYDTFNGAVAKIGSAKKYKDPRVAEALGEMVILFDKIGDKKQVSVMKKRLQTLKKEGLDAQEILNIKRDFERNVKLGYKSSPSTEATKLLFNDRVDTGLRDLLSEVLTENGFPNAKELSKEIQLSRFLADNIDKKLGRQSVNDSYSLTDKILIGAVPAAPKAALGLGLKKLVTSEWWQSKGIKLLADLEDVKKIPEPDLRRIELKKRMNILKKELGNQGIDSSKVDNMVDDILKDRQTTQPKKPFLDNGSTPTNKLNTSQKDVIIEGTKTKMDQNLLNEAKKYKSADEFVKAQVEREYRSAHQVDIKTSSPITEISEDTLTTFTDEFKRQYGYPSLKSKEVNKLKSIMSNPDADVTVYRASPKNELNGGDWVTIDKDYANDIKRQNGGKVFTHTVKASDLFYPKTLEGFEDLPSLNKWGAFQYQSSKVKSQLTDIWNKANK